MFQPLDALVHRDRLLNEFESAGLTFDGCAFAPEIVDEIGHVEFIHELRSVKSFSEIKARLAGNEQLQIEVRDSRIFLVVSFAHAYTKVSFSRSLFDSQPSSVRRDYWYAILRGARLMGVQSIVVVDDPPGYFEDFVLVMDDQMHIESSEIADQLELDSVWISEASNLAFAESSFRSSGTVEGFRRYSRT